MSLPRRDRILVLAWSLPDALRVLESRNTETRRAAPAVWQLCGTCDGNGEVVDRWSKPSTCPVCHGAGRYRSDPYVDGAPVSGAGDLAAPRVTTRDAICDRCDGSGVIVGRYVGETGIIACPSCEGSGHLQIPLEQTAEGRAVADLDLVAWSWRGGDWDALDAALEAMRSNGRRPLWRAFVSAFVEPPYVTTPESFEGLQHVEAMMPRKVRVPRDLERAYREREERERAQIKERWKRMPREHRNREIRAALKLGHSTEQVARMFALSEATVKRVA